MPKPRRLQKFPFEILGSEQLHTAGWELFGKTSTTKAMPPLAPHTHTFMEMVFVINGTQIYAAGNTEYPLRPFEGFISYPHECHSTSGQPQHAVEFYWVQVNTEAQGFFGLSEATAQQLRKAIEGLSGHTFSFSRTAASMLSKCYSCMHSGSLLERHYGISLMRSVLYEVICNQSMETPLLSPEIECALRRIEEQIHTYIPLEKLANEAFLSLSRFKIRFKEEVGENPREYINRLKIEKGKKLLTQGKSVTETAYILDFSSSNYFSMVFKKYTAYTPREYQKLQEYNG